jgi:class IV lanthipeptide synthase
MRTSQPSDGRAVDICGRARTLEKRWQKLCALYLPIADHGSIWNYRHSRSEWPDHGWKLHVSATILNAPGILLRIAPFLDQCGLQFKAARSLSEVATLNSGLLHTYSQVGKIITVYPRDDREAVYLAQRLHELTRRFRAPSVPFDLRFCENSNIYYRYGAFKQNEIKLPDGRRIPAIASPGGSLVPDVRERAKPDWVSDPFAHAPPKNGKRRSPKEPPPSFHVLGALVQRGKGGVYQAIDVESNPPRLCLLKEGRKHGEVSWDGRDGAWRVRNEERVLSYLRARGLKVPKVYSRFELQGNFYLVMEFIDGESLNDLLMKQTRRLPLKRVLTLAVQIATLLAQMHRAGWAWRDCKPKNLIVTSDGGVVPIDFEGASPIKNPDNAMWGTRAFMSPESRQGAAVSTAGDDLFALGSILYLLITGRVFDPEGPTSITKLRRGVPPKLRWCVESLLSEKARHTSAQSVRKELTSILRKYSELPQQRLRNAMAA